MATRRRDRTVIFDVVDDVLIRTVIFPGDEGRSYTHRCPRKSFEAVAHAIDETPRHPPGGAGTSLNQIARQEDLPMTQVNVAMEFLKERGIIDVRCRRSYPAAITTFEDAMTEFCFLAELPY